MQSLATAAALLDGITNVESTGPLLEALGFHPGSVALDRAAYHRLGLGAHAVNARIARGIGSLRALAFDLDGTLETRIAITRIASKLSSTATHLTWLLVGIRHVSGEIVIASWHQGRLPIRIAALVTHRGHIVDSDAETVCALAATRIESDILAHLRWLDILDRQAVGRRFFAAFQRVVESLARSLHPSARPDQCFEMALLYVSRLLFLSFLETKGWLNRDHGFMANAYADCMIKGGQFHNRILVPLFFGTLNTAPRNRAKRAQAFGRIPFLNGGLFARSPLERQLSRASFTDEAMGTVFGDLLTRYRFTAREDTTSWSEASIDPEMLGKSFESLMAGDRRRRTGAFYTPQHLVEQVASSALECALTSDDITSDVAAAAIRGDIPPARHRSRLLRSVEGIRILDPACGSGAFLVYALEQISSLRLRLGDLRSLHAIRRTVLTTSIFGVDVNPVAVWLCELRLWLSMAIEDPETNPLRVAALPNIDRQIRVGDSLRGRDFDRRQYFAGAGRLSRTRLRYSRAVGPRKRSLARALDGLEHAYAINTALRNLEGLIANRKEVIAAARSRDLFGARHRTPGLTIQLRTSRAQLTAARAQHRALTTGAALPFSFATHFADVGAAGGFDIVLGNPPWVRTHNLSLEERQSLRLEYRVFRESAWQEGAGRAGASHGFAGQIDLAALFVERSTMLTRIGGIVALILPAKLWRSLAGGGVRSLLQRETELTEIHDLTGAGHLFEATVYPSVVVARRQQSAADCVRLFAPPA